MTNDNKENVTKLCIMTISDVLWLQNHTTEKSRIQERDRIDQTSNA
jgi:purine-nucleoside phosphorylase